MRNLNNELKNREINFDKLLEYGFINQNDQYVFRTKICNEQFEMIVCFLEEKNTSKLIDIANEEEYILIDIQDSTGEFVVKVREEYENKLQDIIGKCTNSNIFKSKQAKEIIRYVKEKYNDELEFLWKKFDENAIWRNKKNNKWYGALLKVIGNKIGINSDEIIEIIDLRYQKENIEDLIDNNKVFPGYHMNKSNWITLKLDDSMETKEILNLLDNSYKLSLEK